MANQRFQVNIVNKKDREGKQQSALKSVSYCSGQKLTDELTGEKYNFASKRQSVIYSETFAPDGTPSWAVDPVLLAKAIDKRETRRDAQLLRSIDFSLPRELTREQQISLAREIARDYERNHGMIVMLFIHDEGQGNPHAHILLPMRPLNKDGSWGAKSRLVYIRDEQGDKIKLASGNYKSSKVNTTNWNDRGNVETWRELWATHTNTYLEQYGHSDRVYHKSHKRRGLEELPTIPLGPAAHHMEKRGIHTEKGDYNRLVQAYNQWLQVTRSEMRQRIVAYLCELKTFHEHTKQVVDRQRESIFSHLRPQEDHGKRYEYLCQATASQYQDQQPGQRERVYAPEPRRLLEAEFANPERRKQEEEIRQYVLIQGRSAYLQSHGDEQVSHHQSQRRQVRDYAPVDEKREVTHERPSRERQIHTRERIP